MSALHNDVSQCTMQLLSAAPSLIGTAQIWSSVQLVHAAPLIMMSSCKLAT